MRAARGSADGLAGALFDAVIGSVLQVFVQDGCVVVRAIPLLAWELGVFWEMGAKYRNGTRGVGGCEAGLTYSCSYWGRDSIGNPYQR